MKIGNHKQTKTESTVRRKAARRNYILSKVRENSPAFHEHGPYLIADYRNCVVYSGVTLAQADAWLSSKPLRT